MKAKVFGLAMALVALVATGASAATTLAGTGCCALQVVDGEGALAVIRQRSFTSLADKASAGDRRPEQSRRAAGTRRAANVGRQVPLRRSGFTDRRLLAGCSCARSACASRAQRTTDQICGRRLMRAKRRTPISCRHGCRRKEPRFAKRRRASRLSSFFLTNLSVSTTSSIGLFGCCWLWRPGFAGSQGQFQGQPCRRYVSVYVKY